MRLPGLKRTFGQKKPFYKAHPLGTAVRDADQIGTCVALSFVLAGLVGYHYERIVIGLGLVDPEQLRRRKPQDNNPLPLELRDEYVPSLYQIQQVRREQKDKKARP